MTQIPFFIDATFEGDDAPTPFTPVETLQFAYFGNGGDLLPSTFFTTDEKEWNKVGEWLRAFKKFGWVVPCGWDLRNLVWPAVVFNLAKRGESVPGLVMPMEKKWNNMDMVDLKSVVLQGGYSPDFNPSLHDAYSAFFPPSEQDQDRSNLRKMADIYLAYERIK